MTVRRCGGSDYPDGEIATFLAPNAVERKICAWQRSVIALILRIAMIISMTV
jgi:hypothetical protein